MIRLAILLIGTPAAKRQWPWLATLGACWMGASAVMMADASSSSIRVATEVIGGLLLLNGLVLLAGAWASSPGTRKPVVWRALALIVFGLLIADLIPAQAVADSVLFGLVFLVDGLLRLVSATVVRFRGWRASIVAACVEIVLAGLILTDWPLPYRDTVAWCMSLALALAGLTLIRLALYLRRLPDGASITELPMFQPRPWVVPGAMATAATTPRAVEDRNVSLTLYVWTPEGAIEAPVHRPVVSRYIAATDSSGVVSTGHAALELSPDVYISLYPAVDLDHSAHDFTRMLRAGTHNDVPGRWNETHEIEVANWRAPDQSVQFRRFNEHALRRFWAAYRQDNTYNLTSRSCSTVASLALERAVEGSLGHRHPWRAFGLMVVDPYVWLASMLRYRGVTMAWTPGLVLDYGRAIRHIQEREHFGGPAAFVHRWRAAWQREGRGA